MNNVDDDFDSESEFLVELSKLLFNKSSELFSSSNKRSSSFDDVDALTSSNEFCIANSSCASSDNSDVLILFLDGEFGDCDDEDDESSDSSL